MPTRIIYHVTPGLAGWQVKRGRATRASSTHATKAEAIRAAADLATSHPLAQVVVHNAAGVITADRLYDRTAHQKKQTLKLTVRKIRDTKAKNKARAVRLARKRRQAALLGLRRKQRKTRAFSAAVRAGMRKNR